MDYGAIKLPNFTVLGTFCNHIFSLFSQHFFLKFVSQTQRQKKIILFKFFISHATIWNEMPNSFRTRKHSLEQKREWNLSTLWFFLTTVACYLNCLDRVVLVHCTEHWQHFQSVSLSLAVGQTELTWAQNSPAGFEKKYSTLKSN